MNSLVTLVFSKDRAFQLEATLSSFYRAVAPGETPPVTRVLYTTSNEEHEASYRALAAELPWVEFIREKAFKEQLLSAIAGFEFVLFLVDDNIFVRKCSLTRCCDWLRKISSAIGFSLRLGTNTQYCYTLNRSQALPEFSPLESDVLSFPWFGKEADFGYPIEVSSSIYRVGDLRPLLEQLPYKNPNSLEGMASEYAPAYREIRPLLFCPERTITFCAPINRVQDVAINRAGEAYGRTAAELCGLFNQGLRLDVERYQGFVPGGCHEEVPIYLRSATAERVAPSPR